MFAFPFLRLPLIPAKCCLDMMIIPDIVRLALCSKKTHRAIKSVGKQLKFEDLSIEEKNDLSFVGIIDVFRLERRTDSGKMEDFRSHPITMEIKMSDDIKFKVVIRDDDGYHLEINIYVEEQHRQNQYRGSTDTLLMGDTNVPLVIVDINNIYSFWNNRTESFPIMGDYFKKLFKSQIKGFQFTGGNNPTYSENLKAAINWVASVQQTVELCQVESKTGLSEDDYKYILDNVKATTRYDLIGRRCNGFQHSANFKSKYFKLNAAHWFTLANLCDTDCEYIDLLDSRLSNDDLKEYVAHWATGRFVNLKVLDLEIKEDVNVDHILSGLTEKSATSGCTIIQESNSARIKRNDGIVAKISAPLARKFRMSILMNQSC